MIQRIMDDVEIDILMFSVNPAYDLAVAGDILAAEHYRTLEKNAADSGIYASPLV